MTFVATSNSVRTRRGDEDCRAIPRLVDTVLLLPLLVGVAVASVGVESVLTLLLLVHIV